MNFLNFFKRKPKTYFTSDLHFGHRNVISYCKRPFNSIDEMTEGLIKIWNSTVKEGDTVYVLGDFSLNQKWSRNIVPQLNGIKILIPGNHDHCFEFNPKSLDEKSVQEAKEKYSKRREQYLHHGWKSVHQTLELKLKNDQTVLLAHLPYAPTSEKQFDTRYLSLRPKDEGLFLLHGHLHGRYRRYKNMIDVGIDAHNLKLISEDDIIKLMKDKRSYIESSLSAFYEENRDERKNMKGEENL